MLMGDLLRHRMGQYAPSNGTICAIEWDNIRHRMGQNRPFSYLNRVSLHALPLLSTEEGRGREWISLEVVRSLPASSIYTINTARTR